MMVLHLPRVPAALPQLSARSVAIGLLLLLLLLLMLLLLEPFSLLAVWVVVLLPGRRSLGLLIVRVEAEMLRLHRTHGRHGEIQGLVELGSGHRRGQLALRAFVLCDSLWRPLLLLRLRLGRLTCRHIPALA